MVGGKNSKITHDRLQASNYTQNNYPLEASLTEQLNKMSNRLAEKKKEYEKLYQKYYRLEV